MTTDESFSAVKVRNMVSLFETQTAPKIKLRPLRSKSLSKSQADLARIGGIGSEDIISYQFTNLDLAQIQDNLKALEREIKRYKTYSREDHAYFQTELVTILSEIVNIESINESVSKRKRDLILAVRNCNALLTQKLPEDSDSFPKKNVKEFQQSKPVRTSVDHQGHVAKEMDELSSLPPLVKKLKLLFEQKSSESEKNAGLNAIASMKNDADLRRVKSFGGGDSQYRYLSYKDRVKKTQHQSMKNLSDVPIKQEDSIRNNLYDIHNQEVIENIDYDKLKRSEYREKSGFPAEHILESKEFDHLFNFDSEPERSTVKVSDMVKKLERTISTEGNQSLSNNGEYNIKHFLDIEKRFAETDIPLENDHCESRIENVVMLCEPRQRTLSFEGEEVEDIKQVSVHTLVRQLENMENSSRVTLLQRTISETLPNQAFDSDGSDASTSTDTVVHVGGKDVDGQLVGGVVDSTVVENGDGKDVNGVNDDEFYEHIHDSSETKKIITGYEDQEEEEETEESPVD